jgi:hypothetical protein
MFFLADHLEDLQRIAAFSAKLRGHELVEWRAGEGFAQAACILCRAELRVYSSLAQPDMDGPALDGLCGVRAKSAA